MQVTLTPDEATVERVARALYGKWQAAYGRTEPTWDDLLANPDQVRESGHVNGDGVRVWREWARAALTAALDEPPTP